MRIADKWEQYTILDTSSEEKLESWNGVKLIRPDPQIIWKTPKDESLWEKADGHYHRSSSGGGSWEYRNSKPKESWKMSYGNLT